MRRISSIIVLLALSAICFSCNNKPEVAKGPFCYSKESGTVEFDGCKVKGMIPSTLTRFFIETEGFEQVNLPDSTDNGILEFKGKFMDYEGCSAYAIYKSFYAGNTVEEIEIFIPETKDWNRVKNQYFAMKDILSNEFGSPKRCNEIITESDFEKKHPDTTRPILALKEGRCIYTSIFMAPDGTIVTLAITYIPHTKASVEISLNF